MSKTENSKAPERFIDLFRVSWIRSSIIIGIIIIIAGIIILFLLKHFNVGNSQLVLDAKNIVQEYGLVGIFFATILAGTIVPIGSPALVTAAAAFGVEKMSLILIATTGFTIGMTINYGLAYRLGRPYVMKQVTAEKLEETTHLWNRWGWVLYVIFGLIFFLPVELLSLICGLLKTRLDYFLILSFIPRLLVFAMLAYLGEQLGPWIGIA